jgi:hypothetical protein
MIINPQNNYIENLSDKNSGNKTLSSSINKQVLYIQIITITLLTLEPSYTLSLMS